MKKLYFLFLLISFIGFSQSPGDIVITEIMQNPAVISDTTGEWFEIFNSTGSPIDLDGWIIKDNDTDTHTISGSVIVPAGGYITLGISATVNGGLTHAYIYGSDIQLANGADEIVLEAPGSIEIDRVEYDGGAVFPDPTGASMTLDPIVLAGDNNIGSNWCEGTSVYDAVNNNLGTPGAANDACAPTCEAILGSSDTTCDSTGPGANDDTFTATLDYSGAATGETFIVSLTAGTGTIDLTSGDPTNDASGTIVVNDIPEGTDITISVDNTGDGGLCLLTRDITSPVCVPTGSVDLELQGIIDFGIPEDPSPAPGYGVGGAQGKAIHVVATADIADLSIYSVGVANNGGGTDGEEYNFDAIAVNNGDHILVARSLEAMEDFLTTAGYNLFDHLLVANTNISQNGDDAIELYKNGVVVETFGDVNVDGTGQSWDYEDSWAYKNILGEVWPSGWVYGGANCSDFPAGTAQGTWTTFDTPCVYPFVSSLSTEEFSKDELSIYPNPVNNGLVNIKSQLSGVKNVELYDILGRSVLNIKLNSDILDVSSIKSGLYLLKVSIDDRSSTTKLIIK